MPYKSDKQRRYMHAQHPGIAAKWDAEERSAKQRKAGGAVLAGSAAVPGYLGVRSLRGAKRLNTIADKYPKDQFSQQSRQLARSKRTKGGVLLGTAGLMAAGGAGMMSKSLAELGTISKRSGDKSWLESQKDYYREGFDAKKPPPGVTWKKNKYGVNTVDRMTYVKPGKSKEFKGWLKSSGTTKRSRKQLLGDVFAPSSVVGSLGGGGIGGYMGRMRGGPKGALAGAATGSVVGNVAGFVADSGRMQGKMKIHRRRLLREAKGKGYLATGPRKKGLDLWATTKHNAFTSGYNSFPVARKGHSLKDF